MHTDIRKEESSPASHVDEVCRIHVTPRKESTTSHLSRGAARRDFLLGGSVGSTGGAALYGGEICPAQPWPGDRGQQQHSQVTRMVRALDMDTV